MNELSCFFFLWSLSTVYKLLVNLKIKLTFIHYLRSRVCLVSSNEICANRKTTAKLNSINYSILKFHRENNDAVRAYSLSERCLCLHWKRYCANITSIIDEYTTTTTKMYDLYAHSHSFVHYERHFNVLKTIVTRFNGWVVLISLFSEANQLFVNVTTFYSLAHFRAYSCNASNAK